MCCLFVCFGSVPVLRVWEPETLFSWHTTTAEIIFNTKSRKLKVCHTSGNSCPFACYCFDQYLPLSTQPTLFNMATEVRYQFIFDSFSKNFVLLFCLNFCLSHTLDAILLYRQEMKHRGNSQIPKAVLTKGPLAYIWLSANVTAQGTNYEGTTGEVCREKWLGYLQSLRFLPIRGLRLLPLY